MTKMKILCFPGCGFGFSLGLTHVAMILMDELEHEQKQIAKSNARLMFLKVAIRVKYWFYLQLTLLSVKRKAQSLKPN
jgi:hypothetical protein